MSQSLFVTKASAAKHYSRRDVVRYAIAACLVVIVLLLLSASLLTTGHNAATSSTVLSTQQAEIAELRATVRRLSQLVESRAPGDVGVAPRAPALRRGLIHTASSVRNAGLGAESEVVQNAPVMRGDSDADAPAPRPRSVPLSPDEAAHAPNVHRQDAVGNLPHREPSVLIKPIYRVHNISTSEFYTKYGNAFVAAPLVLSGSLEGSYDPADWTRDGFRRICGHRPIRYNRTDCDDDDPCHNVREILPENIGKTWAGLNNTDVNALGIKTIDDFLRVQATTRPGIYIHDATISELCPELLDKFQAPKYFPTDLKLLSSDADYDPDEVVRSHWHPSIFVGVKGSGSPLHSDSSMTRFWLMQLDGRKHVRLVAPAENWRVGVTNPDQFQPTLYGADLFYPDFVKFPDMDGLTVYDAILHPGDLLFVPEGWAHQVINLDDIIATSKNFVDYEAAAMHLRAKKQQFEPDHDDQDAAHNDQWYSTDRMTAWYLPLVQPSENNGNIPWRDFFLSHMLETAPVPKTVVDLVQLKARPPAENETVPHDRWTDAYGRSILEVAILHNFVSVAKYVIEHAGTDAGTMRYDPPSLFEFVQHQNFTKMTTMLRAAGVHGPNAVSQS